MHPNEMSNECECNPGVQVELANQLRARGFDRAAANVGAGRAHPPQPPPFVGGNFQLHVHPDADVQQGHGPHPPGPQPNADHADGGDQSVVDEQMISNVLEVLPHMSRAQAMRALHLTNGNQSGFVITHSPFLPGFLVVPVTKRDVMCEGMQIDSCLPPLVDSVVLVLLVFVFAAAIELLLGSQ